MILLMSFCIIALLLIYLLTYLQFCYTVLTVLLSVVISGLSAGTRYTFTVYTVIDDVIRSGADVTVTMLSNAGHLITYWN